VNVMDCQRIECGRFPRVVVEHTTHPDERTEYSVLVPWALYRDMDPIALDAAPLYRAVATASRTGPRGLCFDTEVLPRLDWPLEVMHVADHLEQRGWLRRVRGSDGAEFWTPLGRDQPQAEPIHALVVPQLPPVMRAPALMARDV
jgi:hypothetical protein